MSINFPARRATLAAFSLLGLAACGGGSGSDSSSPVAVTLASETAVATVAVKVSPSPSPSPGASAAAPAGKPAPSATALVLRAEGVVIDGVGALLTVRYNGEVRGSIEVRAAAATDHVLDIGSIAGGTLDLVFSNAHDGQGRAARHVRIHSVTIGDLVVKPKDPIARFDHGDGVRAFDDLDTDAGQETLTAAGALRFTLPAVSTVSRSLATTAQAGYFVDSDLGSDSNPGTSERPWRTLAKASQVRLMAGEGLYLRCGRVWREALRLNSLQLQDGSTVAGYGSDCALRKAVISATDDFSGGWQKNGNVWSRSLRAGTPKIGQLFLNDRALRTAQWPNATGGAETVARASGGNSAGTSLLIEAADALALQGKDLRGATVQARTKDWLIETRRITNFLPSGFDLHQALTWPMVAAHDFIVQDKRWMLDAPGEYFHDVEAQMLYLIAPDSGAPADINTACIEGSVRDVALAVSQRNNLLVQDISVHGALEDGLRVTDAPSASVVGLEARHNLLRGVALQQWLPLSAAVPGPRITESLLAGSGLFGIDALHVEGARIENNRVYATGVGAQHRSHSLAGIGAGPGAQVVRNVVDGAGYHGIQFSGLRGSAITGNDVRGYCVRLSDCGGIYTWAGRGGDVAARSALLEGNRVVHTSALPTSATGASTEQVVVGIYLDDYSRNVTVRNNLLVGQPAGIFVHNGSGMNIESNRVWMATRTALWASMDQSDGDWMTGNRFHGNEIVPLVHAQRAGADLLPSFGMSQAIWFSHALAGSGALSSTRNLFSANVVHQLQGPVVSHALIRGPGGELYVDAAQWQALNSAESAPQRLVRFNPLRLNLGPELAIDGDFSNGMGRWQSYVVPGYTGFSVSLLNSDSSCVGPCVNFSAGHRGDLISNGSINFQPGATYVYRWKAVMPAASGAAVGSPYIGRAGSPWDQMTDGRGYVGYLPRRGGAGEVVDFETFFVAKSADPARVMVQLDTLGVGVRFDNVSVRQVTGYEIAQTGQWATLAQAPLDASRSVSCVDVGWPAGCSAIDTQGRAVAFPLLLAAGTDKLLLRADSPFRR